jgi:inosose dehydratase
VLNLTVANCPVSWGIEELGDPRNTPWPAVLDEMAAAGYRSVELGLPGYLPTDVTQMHQALHDRRLTLSAGYVMGHYGMHGSAAVDADALRATCEALAGFSATTLLVMEDMNDVRDATSGRSSDAERLSEEGWTNLIERE